MPPDRRRFELLRLHLGQQVEVIERVEQARRSDLARLRHWLARMAQIPRTRYLFDTVAVAERLRALPAVREKLRVADDETQESTAFPGHATNPRQLYRVLAAAAVYPWLEKLLDSLEFALRRDWWYRRILSSDRQQFRGAIAELHAAEHFLLRGFDLRPEPEVGEGRADLHVGAGDLETIVEVVAPIELKALNDFFDTCRDVGKHLDVPYDYCGRIAMGQLDTFSESGELLHLNPIVLARQLTQTTAVNSFAAQVAGGLVAGQPFQVDQLVPDLNVRLVAEFADITPAKYSAPTREIALSLPGLSGYAPEAIVDNILGKVNDKARGRQAGEYEAGGPGRLLIADLSTGEVSSEWQNAWYRRRFERMAQERLGPLVGPAYDAIALVEPLRWGEQLSVYRLLYDDERLTADELERLFGKLTKTNDAGA
jgi:hypothetical protein